MEFTKVRELAEPTCKYHIYNKIIFYSPTISSNFLF